MDHLGGIGTHVGIYMGVMMYMVRGAIVNIAQNTQDECGNFCGIGTGKYRRYAGYELMVLVFHGSAVVQNQE